MMRSPGAHAWPRTGTPACPRCGYDQSGVLATWTDACPTHSTCSECGLSIRWRDVLSPSHGRVAWLYEHGRGPAFGRLVQSLAMALVPVRFWRRVRMSHQVHPARLVLMVVLVLAGLHLLLGLNRLAAETWHHHNAMTNWTSNQSGAPSPTPARWSDAWDVVSQDGNWGVVLVKLAVPVAGLHSAQSLGYSLDDALSIPSRWLLLLHPLWALMLLALPDTRAIAKVRPAHIARALAYPVALLLVLMYLGAGVSHWLEALGLMRGRAPRSTLGEWTATLTSLAWAAWWWFEVCRRYLRLPRPILVWLVTGAVSHFATLVLGVVFAVFLFRMLTRV